MLNIQSFLQRRSRLLLALGGVTLGMAIALQPLQLGAVQLGDGSTMFNSPPRLVDFLTTEDTANSRNATYYVTVNLLPEAGESLRTLEVTLIEGRFPRLDYRTDAIEVFQGERGDRQAPIPLASAQFSEETDTLTIQLAEPAQPGQLITFALKPVRNPSYDGVYLFEVTAAPAGENPVFQRVGTGRINIFRPDSDPYYGPFRD